MRKRAGHRWNAARVHADQVPKQLLLSKPTFHSTSADTEWQGTDLCEDGGTVDLGREKIHGPMQSNGMWQASVEVTLTATSTPLSHHCAAVGWCPASYVQALTMFATRRIIHVHMRMTYFSTLNEYRAPVSALQRYKKTGWCTMSTTSSAVFSRERDTTSMHCLHVGLQACE